MSDHEQSRAAFEAAHKWYHPFRMPGGAYFDLKMERDWQAWCRALDYAASRECVWTCSNPAIPVVETGCGYIWNRDRGPFCTFCGGRVKIQPQTNEEQ